MLERFGFFHNRPGWTHPNFPGCVITLKMSSFIVNSDSNNKYACAQFIREKMRSFIISKCTSEINILRSVGYELADEFMIYLQRDCQADLQICMITKNGPVIEIVYENWFSDCVYYVVGGKTGGVAHQFDEIWNFLPPIYSAYLSVTREHADLIALRKKHMEEIKLLRSTLDEIYAPGGIGAKAAAKHFKSLQ